MHDSYLKAYGKKRCYILKSNILHIFDIFLDLVILVYFNAISKICMW